MVTIKRGKDNDKIIKMMEGLGDAIKRTARFTREDVADSAFNEAQRTVPVDKSILQQSGNVNHFPNRSEIVYRAPYAAAVHEGTRPHEIRPKTKKFLRFEAGPGRVQRLSSGSRRKPNFVFAKVVKHPGTKPNPWLIRAVKKHLDRWGELWDKNFNKEVGRI